LNRKGAWNAFIWLKIGKVEGFVKAAMNFRFPHILGI
jgi:hypothetical protein